MCGISAAKTQEQYGPRSAALIAAKIASNQLGRGSQGAGIAWRTSEGENMVHVFKRPESPTKFLKDNEPKIEALGATAALGHNRWPSHGDVKQKNTHPFKSCDGSFALVHNGSASIPKGIFGFLAKRGHTVQGDTDSEMFMHTIEELLAANGGDRLLALRSFNKLAASFSILLIFKDGEIWGTRDTWPAIIAMRPGMTLVASEEGGFREIIDEKEVVKLFTPGKHTIWKIDADNLGMTFWGDYKKEERKIEQNVGIRYVYCGPYGMGNPIGGYPGGLVYRDQPDYPIVYDPIRSAAAQITQGEKNDKKKSTTQPLDLELLERANSILPPGDQVKLGSKKERKKLRKLIKGNLWLREQLDEYKDDEEFFDNCPDCGLRGIHKQNCPTKGQRGDWD